MGTESTLSPIKSLSPLEPRLMKLVLGSWYRVIHVLILASLGAFASTNYDDYLLSCGAPTPISPTSYDNRAWGTDNNSTFSTNFSSTLAAKFSSSINNHQVPQSPFSTARVFISKADFTYSFPVSPGPKFIRLFFSPSNYSSYSLSVYATDAYLTVRSSTGHLLLRNFSAYLFSGDPFFKEFYVHVNDSRLQLTFFPEPPSPYAYLNGIEIVSVPESLYISTTPPTNVDQPNVEINLGISTALETAYRFNVGGSQVDLDDNSGNMYRQWLNDDKYFLYTFQGLSGYHDTQKTIQYTTGTPNYSAPLVIYETMRFINELEYNLTWSFKVDIGFLYLVRMHWCELEKSVDSVGIRVFDVYLNYLMADEAFDIVDRAKGNYKAMYKDYLVNMHSTNGIENKGDLQLAMHSSYLWPKSRGGILNGLEIFKLSRTNGSLDAPNPPPRTPTDQAPHSPQSSSSHINLAAIIGAVSGVIILSVLLCCVLIFRRRKLSKKLAGSYGTSSSKSKRFIRSGKSDTTKRSGGGSSSLPSHLCHYFSLEEIRLATSDFSESLIIGHGGFGNVYKGTVNTESGPTTVAIKRLNPLSNQGAREFAMEIQLLSKLRHLHLVSLIGYCDTAGEMILIYEYMSHGTLRDHLFPHNVHPNEHLPWARRLQICVGAARGLNYLHTGTDRMVIHRDVKSTNILLDERWVAKVSDFGLSKLGPAGGDLVSHVSTVVKGSFGYVDPEYYRRQQLTEKSDVYSFGVVLFEVLCGRAAVNPNLPKEQVNLRIWARRNQLSGTLDTIVDPMIKGQISPECLRKFGDVAESCVRDEGVHRPSMADVIGGLELAIKLQLEASLPKSVDHVLSGTRRTSSDHVITYGNTLDDDLHFPTTNTNSPIRDTSVRMIKSTGESTWTSMNNSSRLFSNSDSEATGGSTDVFSQIFKADGR